SYCSQMVPMGADTADPLHHFRDLIIFSPDQEALGKPAGLPDFPAGFFDLTIGADYDINGTIAFCPSYIVNKYSPIAHTASAPLLNSGVFPAYLRNLRTTSSLERPRSIKVLAKDAALQSLAGPRHPSQPRPRL